jgi:hypothetical protein
MSVGKRTWQSGKKRGQRGENVTLTQLTFFCYDCYDPIYSCFSFPYHVLARTVFNLLDEFLSSLYSWSCDQSPDCCQERCPVYIFFFVFLSLFCPNPHSFVMTETTLFILIFYSLTAYLRIHYSTCQTSFSLSFIPCHVIDHLTTMCQPHGFVVTDRDCSQPVVAFIGFHVCPLLETKHSLCAVHLSYI